MKRAFTLVELLVVIGIMGFLGTVSVGGYRAMQRGMEERGVMQNVNTVVKTAFERAQIDRQPTAMFFWNETIRSSTMDENEIVVGRAVAVRRQGRLSGVSGNLLIDEFADLDLAYATGQTVASGDDVQGNIGENTMFLYCLDNLGGGEVQLKRSVVYSLPDSRDVTEVYMGGLPNDNAGSGKITLWGFRVKEKNGVDWKVGTAYGFEFAEITLPHNYIFGSTYSKTVEDPIRGEAVMVFGVGTSSSSGQSGQNANVTGSMTVYSLRPDGSGGLRAEKVDSVKTP